MPLPSPKKKESSDKFIASCMSSLKSEFPNEKQRLAVCYSQLEKRSRASIDPKWEDLCSEQVTVLL